MVELHNTDILYSIDMKNFSQNSNIAVKFGCQVNAQNPNTMSVDISLGAIYWENNTISVSQQTLTLDNSGSLGRIDLILINSAGNCSILKGNESIEPYRAPNYDINNYYCLATITVDASITSINSTNINDKRLILKLNEDSEYKITTAKTSTETNESLYPFTKLLYSNPILIYNNSGNLETLPLDSNNKIEYITGLNYDYIKGTSDSSKTDFMLLNNFNYSQNNDKTKLDLNGFNKLTNPIKEIKLTTYGVSEKNTITDSPIDILVFPKGIVIFQNTGDKNLYLSSQDSESTTLYDCLLLKPDEAITIYVDNNVNSLYYQAMCKTDETTTLNTFGVKNEI